MNNEKIKDLLCYLLLMISILLFICTFALLKPIELIGEFEDYDLMPDNLVKEDIFENGLEHFDIIKEKYIGEIDLEKKWIYFTLMFTNYRDIFIEEYDKYNLAEDSDEKRKYEKDISVKYGIDTQEERDSLYNAFNEIYKKNGIIKDKSEAFEKRTVIVKIEVLEDSVLLLEDGINFDIKATQFDNTEILFNCTIFDKYISKDEFLKILPKEVTQEVSEGE